eukprot:1522190-Pyramimonas_sp.AAC.1
MSRGARKETEMDIAKSGRIMAQASFNARTNPLQHARVSCSSKYRRGTPTAFTDAEASGVSKGRSHNILGAVE